MKLLENVLANLQRSGIYGDVVDAFIVESLKDQLEGIQSMQLWHPEDIKMYKKLSKAIKVVLSFYGVDDEDLKSGN